MKVVLIVAGMAIAGLAAAVPACAPEEKYCWCEKSVCSAVAIKARMACEEQNEVRADAGLPPNDCTAIQPPPCP
jgi:hypothetical protein